MRVPITFDYNGKGIKQAKAGLGALLKSTLGLQLGVAGLTTAFIRLGRESVAAAMADEKAYKILGQTLKSAGFDNAIDGVKGLIDAQQIATGVAEDQLIPAYTTLFNALQSVSAAQYSLKLAQDVALATGKDLNQVTSAFAKAAKGSTTALGRLGIGLSKAELASGDFERIIRSLETRFSGSTAAAIETTAVKFDRLKVAVGEAKEEIGKGLLDAFSLAQSASAKSTDQMQQDIIRLGTTIGDVIRGIGGVTGQLRTSMPDAISQAIGDGFRQAFGTYGDVAILLKNYGEALRLETETSVRQGFSNVYSGGPRADRPSQETVGRKLLIQQQRASYLAEQARKRAAAAEAARQRATEAQRKKAAALEAKTKQLAQQFDLELIGLAAAKRKTTDQETITRLTALQALAQQGYNSESNSIEDLDRLLKKLAASQRAYTDSINGSATAWTGVADAAAAAQQAMSLIQSGKPAQIIAGGNIVSNSLADLAGQMSDFQATLPPATPGLADAAAAAQQAMSLIQSAKPAQIIAGGNIVSNSLADLMGQMSNFQATLPPATPGLAAPTTTPSVTVINQGPVIGADDIDQMVQNAVNRVARSGGRFAQQVYNLL